MAFKSSFTERYRLPYFGDGFFYSGEADRRRFVTLDRHIEKFIGIAGVGVISGWIPTHTTGLTVEIPRGTGIINGYYSESGWVVKKTEDVLPTDQVIEYGYYTDPDTGQVYDKVQYRWYMTLPDDSDAYIYAYRNSAYLITDPYLEPDNDAPVAETSSTLNPARTAAAFGYASTFRQATSSNRVFIGQVTTRNGAVTLVDTSQVDDIENLQSAIREYGERIINQHRHGGSDFFDPPQIKLEVDRRQTALHSSSETQVVYRAEYNERTSEEEGHKHSYTLDSDGDGITIDTIGDGDYHYHLISSYALGEPTGTTESTPSHTHAIEFDANNPDGWGADDTVVIYVNDEIYTGDSATTDAGEKTVTFTGDVTVKKRTYSLSHTLSNGETYSFQSSETSLYRFMLRASLDFYNQNLEAIQNGTLSIFILPDPETPISALEDQSLVGETRLAAEGDTFLFVDPAADDVTVTLVQAQHVDTVELEITTNSEVTGRLPQSNILYIPASKIASGEFLPARIPELSHMGRFLELCEPTTKRARSTDGRTFEIERGDLAGNAKVVYSASDDGSGNYLLGTSDGLYRHVDGGVYYWVVNGVEVVTETGDIRTRMEEAADEYTSQTDQSLIIDERFDDQITEAEKNFTAIGDYYEFIGNRNEEEDTGFDELHVFYVQDYRFLKFGYTMVRREDEIRADEEILYEIEDEETDTDEEDGVDTEESSEEEELRFFMVKNDFHRNIVKAILPEPQAPFGYQSVADQYTVAASEMLANTNNVDDQWALVNEAEVLGYIYNLVKNYSGLLALATSTGFRIATSPNGGYNQIRLPAYVTEIADVTFGYDDLFIIAYEGTVASTSNLGKDWATSSPSAGDIRGFTFDPTLDTTTVVSGHSHSVDVDIFGQGTTSTVTGHAHTVEDGVLAAADGHTHSVVRTFYAFDSLGMLYRSVDDGATWQDFGSIPSDSQIDHGPVFAAFGKLWVSTDGALIWTTNGSTWNSVSISDNIHSAQWDRSQDELLLGTENELYTFDGTTLTLVLSYSGTAIPAVYVDGIQRMLTWRLNNVSNTIDFKGIFLDETPVDVIDEFSLYYPEQDGWSDGIPYDLYVNDRILKSTKRDINRTDDLHVNVSNVSVIDFGVSSELSEDVAVGDLEIKPADVSNFPSSGTVKISLSSTPEGQDFAPTYFFDFSSVTNDSLLLSSRSRVAISAEAADSVQLISALDGRDEVRITVYEGKITSVGENTHYEIEDALYREEIGLDKPLADVYTANLVHLTIAAGFAMPGVDDEFENSFITTFEYNDTPGDPDNIDRWIDREASDLASLSIYDSGVARRRSSLIYRIVQGFSDFSNYLFVASNVGFFVMDRRDSLEANWFRVDIDGEVGCFDVLQYTDSKVYVATTRGLYESVGSTLTQWRLINENVIGGVAKRIAPRWGPITDQENPISYWWGDFETTVNVNESLINSILVAGDDFVTVSDDRGASWRAATYPITDYLVARFQLLQNGSIASCLNGVDSLSSGVYTATDTGGEWETMFAMSSFSGTVDSISITDVQNAEVSVTWSGDVPQDGLLSGREFTFGNTPFEIVDNRSDVVILFGVGIFEETGTRFVVPPPAVNVLHEDTEKQVALGTSVGILSDQGEYFSALRQRNGFINSYGNRAVIQSVNITGVVDSVVNIGGTVVANVTLDQNAAADQFVDYSMRFTTGAVDVKIGSNSGTRPDGSMTITAAKSDAFVVAGVNFSIVGPTIRIFVEYDGVVTPDQLKGGVLFLEPTAADYGLTRDELVYYDITSNGTDWIDVAVGFNDPFDTQDPFLALADDTVVFASNSDGTVPVFVEFENQPRINGFRGNAVSARGVDGFPSGASVPVKANDEISLTLDESYTAEDGNYTVYNTLLEGLDFFFTGLPFNPMESFNDRTSSVSYGHLHDLAGIEGPITGTIDSLGAVTSTTIELNLTDTENLDDSFVQAHTNLFADEELLAYDPSNPEVTYRLTIVSHGSDKFTVVKSANTFDLTGGESKKVGDGYKVVLSTVGYGYTTSTEFEPDFVTERKALASDVFIGGSTFTVADASDLLVGANVRIFDGRGVEYDTRVSSTGSTTFNVEDESPFDFLVEDGASVDVLYTMVEVDQQSLTSDASAGTQTVTVADTSLVKVGDVADMRDSRGQYQRSAVQSILSPTSVQLEDELESDYKVANSALASFRRANYTESHEHTMKRREFTLHRDDDRVILGDPATHGHYPLSLIGEVVDVKTINGVMYAAGSGRKIMKTTDNGENWEVDVDLNEFEEFRPLPVTITGIYTDGSSVFFATSSGYIVYKAVGVDGSAVPLRLPV